MRSNATSTQAHNHLLENEGGKAFVDRTAEHVPKTLRGAMGIRSFDDDNDGRTDLLITDMHSGLSEWSKEMLQGGADSIFGNATEPR